MKRQGWDVWHPQRDVRYETKGSNRLFDNKMHGAIVIESRHAGWKFKPLAEFAPVLACCLRFVIHRWEGPCAPLAIVDSEFRSMEGMRAVGTIAGRYYTLYECIQPGDVDPAIAAITAAWEAGTWTLVGIPQAGPMDVRALIDAPGPERLLGDWMDSFDAWHTLMTLDDAGGQVISRELGIESCVDTT